MHSSSYFVPTPNWNSKLCHWHQGVDLPQDTFYNQALNTLAVYGGRSFVLLNQSWKLGIPTYCIDTDLRVNSSDARTITFTSTFWITDPPYADAINYHELSEFFLAWYQKPLEELFPDWYPDSKRALAVTGSDEEFRKSMVEIYGNLTKHMPDNGAHVVMFTHQDARVWADLAMILWASGLQVTAAWCIATETNTALKSGNYVQGTVLLVLRKQRSDETAFLDEIYPEVEEEVKKATKLNACNR